MYSKTILERIASPQYNKLPLELTSVGCRKSKKCEDSLKLGLYIADGTIVNIGYSHSGCALSLGSTDYLCSLVHNLNVNDAKAMIYRVLEAVPTAWTVNGEEVLSIRDLPHRTECVVGSLLLMLTLLKR